MYIKWVTWIILFDDHIRYMKKLGVTRILQFSKRNGKSTFTKVKKGQLPGNYHL